jgi:hypothetical protein
MTQNDTGRGVGVMPTPRTPSGTYTYGIQQPGASGGGGLFDILFCAPAQACQAVCNSEQADAEFVKSGNVTAGSIPAEKVMADPEIGNLTGMQLASAVHSPKYHKAADREVGHVSMFREEEHGGNFEDLYDTHAPLEDDYIEEQTGRYGMTNHVVTESPLGAIGRGVSELRRHGTKQEKAMFGCCIKFLLLIIIAGVILICIFAPQARWPWDDLNEATDFELVAFILVLVGIALICFGCTFPACFTGVKYCLDPRVQRVLGRIPQNFRWYFANDAIGPNPHYSPSGIK